MKRNILTLLILVIFGTLTISAQTSLDIEVKNLDGESTTLAQEIKGEIIVLDFWTTWCKPCIRSIPKLVTLSEKFEESQVQFIGVNEDNSRNEHKVKPLVESLEIPYTVILDAEQVLLAAYKVRAYPTLLILNKAGEVLYTHVGFSPSDEVELETKIKSYLSK